jgi:DNA-binding NarL/FixJ family response regulator
VAPHRWRSVCQCEARLRGVCLSKTITVLIAGGSRISREVLRNALLNASNLRVVGEAADSPSVIQMVAQLRPRIVLLSSALPIGGVLPTTRKIVSESHKQVGVVILSTYPVRVLSSDARRAGSAGYIDEESSLEDLLTCIGSVAAGRPYFVGDGEGTACRGGNRPKDKAPPGLVCSARKELSRRELQVLEMLSDGLHVDDIAKNLFISRKTVESHRSHVMAKLNLRTIAGLTKYAIQSGLTALDGRLDSTAT